MATAPDGAGAALHTGGRPSRIGLFGGTFDPPHTGHVIVAGDVADALDLDQVLWIPAAVPPHKSDAPPSPAPVRRAMVAAAVDADPRFRISDVELDRGGPSYTVDTLRQLRGELNGAELYLILGADQVRTLATGWREPEEVLRLAILTILDRDDLSARAVLPDLPGAERARYVPVTRVDVSSSEVRAQVAAGEDVSSMVPPAVLEIILREGLYRS